MKSELEILAELGYVPESYYYEKFQQVNVPRVKVIDEDGKECCTGYYILHFNRTPSPIGDSHKEEDVEHLVAVDEFSDWNMPRGIKIKRVTPPHKIVLLED